MAPDLRFETDGADWPHRESSRFVRAGGLMWHVQETVPDRPQASTILLLHGTGAATHSWRGIVPGLVPDYRVIAPDLPGHGFTSRPGFAQHSLPGMAALTAKLLERLTPPPDVVVGHSAGAAIAARMILDGRIKPKLLISLAGAFLPFAGARASLFSLSAKMLALNPLTSHVFAWRARNPDVVQELLGRTGSRIDSEGMRCYSILARNPRHAGAALTMMASWNLQPLLRAMPKLEPQLILVTGERDGMIPTTDAETVQGLVPGSKWIALEGVGHLAHEEDPDRVCDLIRTSIAGIEA